MAAARSVVRPDRRDEFDELIERHKSLRKLGRLMFGAFSFRSFRPDDPVLRAVDHLRALYGGRKLPAQAPFAFMTRKWRRRVRSDGVTIDLRAWEVAVLIHLRERLRAGDIWVDGSRAWQRSFEDYLLPRPILALMRAEGRLGLAIPDSFAEWRAILNKGEGRHALARAVFLHQLGELRNRVAETMAYRASGLNLVVNAIILWNTVYLSRAVDYVRTQGIDIPAELLSQVAPLPWAHIALTGDYLWNEIDRPLERFRTIRANRLNPNNFAFP
ncbi:Tn3 transposase DDE domain-containing protein [Shinella granuli]|uniref:Tn3 transposase DDE domain-containing protein n=1 Tax=Shinella granuli TaxID=323621 RepID=A0A4R2C4Q5_SHIGR|nr:Tn3 transposase DDE domain-containing protein [Shinella granuli]